jgi:hypothetical protein
MAPSGPVGGLCSARKGHEVKKGQVVDFIEEFLPILHPFLQILEFVVFFYFQCYLLTEKRSHKFIQYECDGQSQ